MNQHIPLQNPPMSSLHYPSPLHCPSQQFPPPIFCPCLWLSQVCLLCWSYNLLPSPPPHLLFSMENPYKKSVSWCSKVFMFSLPSFPKGTRAVMTVMTRKNPTISQKNKNPKISCVITVIKNSTTLLMTK